MATIGSLAVNVVAKTDKLVSGLNSAKSSLTKFVDGISSVQAGLAGLAAYGFASIVQGALDTADKLDALTSKLHLNAEAIQALDYAANQLGTSTDAMHSGIAKMTKLLGEAGAGSQSAQTAFAALGLQYQDLLKLPVEQQFLSVIDALHKIPNANQEAAAAGAIFGKGQAELNGLIAAGTDRIIQLGEALAKSGALVRNETVDALDEAGDSVGGLSAQWEAIKTNFSGLFAPAITKGVQVISAALNLLNQISIGVQAAMIGGFMLIEQAIKGVIAGLNVLLPKSLEIGTSFLDAMLEHQQGQMNALGHELAIVQGREQSLPSS